jgi:hypothetical protein
MLGFSILEVIVTLTILVSVISLVVTNVTNTTRSSKQIISHQQRMESIFHTVEMIRSDLTKCGMRLQEAAGHYGLSLFAYSNCSFKVIQGVGDESLQADSHEGEESLIINRNDYFKKRKKVILYTPETNDFEFNEIKGIKGTELTLSNPLENDYPRGAVIIVLKEVEYKLYSDDNVLKRKVDRGYFQPLIEEVTAFNVKYYPESLSVLYLLEVQKKEQIRGYIYMPHMRYY